MFRDPQFYVAAATGVVAASLVGLLTYKLLAKKAARWPKRLFLICAPPSQDDPRTASPEDDVLSTSPRSVILAKKTCLCPRGSRCLINSVEECRFRNAGRVIRKTIGYEKCLYFVRPEEAWDQFYDVLIGGEFCPRLMGVIEESMLRSARGGEGPNGCLDRVEWFMEKLMTDFELQRLEREWDNVDNVAIFADAEVLVRLCSRYFRWSERDVKDIRRPVLGDLWVLGLEKDDEPSRWFNKVKRTFYFKGMATWPQREIKDAGSLVSDEMRRPLRLDILFVNNDGTVKLPWYGRKTDSMQ